MYIYMYIYMYMYMYMYIYMYMYMYMYMYIYMYMYMCLSQETTDNCCTMYIIMLVGGSPRVIKGNCTNYPW